jgi:16S rRNA (cytidine1402-2'-O)-methyltransferase
LPRRDGPRDERLAELKREPRTLVFYEAVHRIAATVAAMAAVFGSDRRAAVARELTKVHEQISAGTLEDLGRRLGGEIPLLGEFVIVVAGQTTRVGPDSEEAKRIYELLATELDPGRALKLATAITGLSRNELYRLVRT